MKIYDNYFKKIEKKVPTLQIQFESKRKNMSYQYSSTSSNQRFHSASIGKVFCATLIMMAVEENLIKKDTKIHKLLEKSLLENLFVFKGIDYKEDITVSQLLSHTSGVNDYYEGKTINHKSFITMIMEDKNHIFTPYELVDFTKKYQQAIGKPGHKFLYSDTGYVLLGLLLEKLYKKSYYQILKDKIFSPLFLKDTALCFYDDLFNKESLAPIIFKGVDMHLENSLSCDFAGGGLQTTTNDLSIFLKSLFTYKLISKSSVIFLTNPINRFHGIMKYGYGIIEIKFHRLVPWMRNYPTLYGGLGSLSVHAFYDPANDDVYIMNLGSPTKMRLSFQILVKMAKWLNK